jgi:hypothetical protein
MRTCSALPWLFVTDMGLSKTRHRGVAAAVHVLLGSMFYDETDATRLGFRLPAAEDIARRRMPTTPAGVAMNATTRTSPDSGAPLHTAGPGRPLV